MEPMRFDVKIEPTPAAVVVDGTVCWRCASAFVVVITRLVEVERTDMPSEPEFAMGHVRYCRECGTCR